MYNSRMAMVRIDILITKEQFSFLKNIPGTVSEHIRRAIDDYVVKMKGNNASVSPTKKGVEKHG